jgi:glycosyltransferase involved in cell wall biosynthesis
MLKGTHTIADAMAHMDQLLRRTNRTIHLVFFGLVTDCPEHHVPLTECVSSSATGSISATVLKPLPRAAYPWLVDTLDPVAALIASKFETFNLATHEMIAMGLTVVVSDIPAFRELTTRHDVTI